MLSMDLNADIGEADTTEWARAEKQVLRYISSANIACGAHAGSPELMRDTVRAAKRNGVTIGAHPSYPDRENFGRVSKTLGKDIDANSLKKSLSAQITTLVEIAADEGVAVTYVKPHGALYNDAVANLDMAMLIVEVIAALDDKLVFMGGPKSQMVKLTEPLLKTRRHALSKCAVLSHAKTSLP